MLICHSVCLCRGGKEGEEKTRGGEVNVMVRIAEEIRLWLQLEPFRFPPASLNWNQNVKDVSDRLVSFTQCSVPFRKHGWSFGSCYVSFILVMLFV